MKVQVQVGVSAQAYYQVLIDSLLQDVQANTNKKVDSLTEGYTYKKKGTKDSVKVKIKRLRTNQEYRVHFSTHQATLQIAYTFDVIDTNRCMVTYEEVWIGQKEKKDLWKRPERRAKRMIRKVESEIKKQQR